MELIVCPLAHTQALYSTHHEGLKSTPPMRVPQLAYVCTSATPQKSEGVEHENEGVEHESEGVEHESEGV